MNFLQEVDYCLTAIVGFFILIFVLAFRQAYKQNKANLEAQTGTPIKPMAHRFVFSWYVYSLFFVVPALLILGFLPVVGRAAVNLFLFVMPILWLFGSIPAYPYFVLVVDQNRINGATLSGIVWKRIEININDVDKEKVLKKNLGRKLGVTVFHSTKGEKILSLGLDDAQVLSILESPQKIAA